MIVSATLLCDRKASSQLIAIPVLSQHPLIKHVYINIEGGWADYKPLHHHLKASGKLFDMDVWDVIMRTDWRKPPTYDQDVARLAPIVMGRNMAIDYAWSMGADYLLFVDADVRPHPGSIERLVELDVPLCGGLVPGRGVHSNVQYVFGIRREEGDLIYCSHGTCGFMLIRRDVFEVLRFRYGPHPQHRGTWLSEDPAFCADAAAFLGIPDFIVHRKATADHVDDPLRPLTRQQAVEGYDVTW